jgi:hypothetical protein
LTIIKEHRNRDLHLECVENRSLCCSGCALKILKS